MSYRVLKVNTPTGYGSLQLATGGASGASPIGTNPVIVATLANPFGAPVVVTAVASTEQFTVALLQSITGAEPIQYWRTGWARSAVSKASGYQVNEIVPAVSSPFIQVVINSNSVSQLITWSVCFAGRVLVGDNVS